MRTTAPNNAILCSLGFLFLALTLSVCLAFSVYTSCFFNQNTARRGPYLGILRSEITIGCESSVAHHLKTPFWSSLGSRKSIETVIHTGDCEDYDVNCIQYRKARFWRELSTPEIEEEIRKVRKVLAKIELYRKTKNPALHPSSLGNTRRTLAQLLFIRHERHLRSLREKSDSK
ncbi:uncharacterized protein BXIN_0004 [Babesia sp. Xinjiang]|uniref:uncharacterized protein n=1 Tax=Babesia sp. Xinjiang TaxID=462227 RepID=UPI000A2165C5|nr:uncharacterized protein BXIN_0004 [Babesia sp. Xinjiang]ORM39794.1 hypothetical protein BXIN_0004 [Babesia sp. Xinjiang]